MGKAWVGHRARATRSKLIRYVYRYIRKDAGSPKQGQCGHLAINHWVILYFSLNNASMVVYYIISCMY